MINDYSIHDTTDMYINMRQVTGTCTAYSMVGYEIKATGGKTYRKYELI